jgi:ribosome biogenesis GTPase
MKGKVTKSTGSWYIVKVSETAYYNCRLAGQFRLKGIKNTNPIAVGDRVVFEVRPDGKGLIVDLLDRKNYIIRKSVNLSKQGHIIAANLDQSLLIISLASPKTLLGFIDRFLVTAEAYSIPSLLVLNKSDLITPELEPELRYLKTAYSQAGYPFLQVSAQTKEGIDSLREKLRGKTTLVSGNSGVGKSSLINALAPDLDLKTQILSKMHKQGQHTTTFAELFTLDASTEIIDTPGIKGFGLVDMQKSEIGHYFPEIFELSDGCRFNNCLHVEEPGCAVRAAYEEGELAPSRYERYLSILSSKDEDGPYRSDIYAE